MHEKNCIALAGKTLNMIKNKSPSSRFQDEVTGKTVDGKHEHTLARDKLAQMKKARTSGFRKRKLKTG